MVEITFERPELPAGLGLVVGQGAHAHYPGNEHVLQLRKPGIFEQLSCFLPTKAELAFFFGDLELEQAGNDPANGFSPPVDLKEQFRAVDGMDQVYEGYDVLDLVGLQVSDEMPADVGGENGLLFQQFLNAILSEIALPFAIQAQDRFRAVGFRYGDQFDLGFGQFLLKGQ